VVLGDPNYAGNQLWAPSLTADGLSLYFAVTVPGVNEQVAVTTRPDLGSPFGLGMSLPPEVNAGFEGTPFISPDGLSLYFFSVRGGGLGDRDLYVAVRTSTAVEFSNVQHLVELNSPQIDHLPWVSADNLTIYFTSTRAGSGDLLRATRSAANQAFSAPLPVAELNSSSNEGSVSLSADQRVALITSQRPGGLGGSDLWLARRSSTAELFSTPDLLTELNSSANDMGARFSPDGTEVYFTSNRNGGAVELWRAQRTCP
jgi:Tol biopolymer transport system component